MKYHRLGRTGLKLSCIGLGTMTLGTEVTEADSLRLIKTALDAGINYLDTADTYGDGIAEKIIGKAIKGQRDAVLIATKFGQRPGSLDFCTLSRKAVMKSIEDSLRRMDVDYVDIYYAHTPDYETPLEETLGALDDLVHQGKVRYIGCSTFKAWMLCKSLWVSDRRDLVRFDSVMSPYSLLNRDIEYELLPLCTSERVGVCVYNPLAGELLTGRHTFGAPPAAGRMTMEAKGKGDKYIQRYWSETNFAAVERLKVIAKERRCTLTEFALAWILSNPAITSLLTGCVSIEQLNENLRSVEIMPSKEEQSACDSVWNALRPPRHEYGR